MAARRGGARIPDRWRRTVTGTHNSQNDSYQRCLDGRKNRFSFTNQGDAGAVRVAARPA